MPKAVEPTIGKIIPPQVLSNPSLKVTKYRGIIETFVGKKMGIAKRPTTRAAYLNGIFARANPAVKDKINCKDKMPKVKIKEFKNIRGVITSRASEKFSQCSVGGSNFGGYVDTSASVISEPETK